MPLPTSASARKCAAGRVCRGPNGRNGRKYTALNFAQKPPDKLLILDLDETLVCAIASPLPEKSADFRAGFYHVYKRPGVDKFLAACFADFAVAVWTSTTPLYAGDIVAHLFGQSAEKLLFVWASDKCSRGYDAETQENYPRKNIKKVCRRFGFPLASIIAAETRRKNGSKVTETWCAFPHLWAT